LQGLTDTQQEILEYLSDYYHQKGVAPSQAEIAEHFKISGAGAYFHLVALSKKGKIALSEGKARSIKILDPEYAPRVEVFSLPYYPNAPKREELLSFTSKEHIKASTLLIEKGKGYFALRMGNNTMLNAGIKEGDLLYFERCEKANSKDIVAVSIMDEEEVLIRRFVRLGERYELLPECDNVGAIVCQECTIYGILRNVVRKL